MRSVAFLHLSQFHQGHGKPFETWPHVKGVALFSDLPAMQPDYLMSQGAHATRAHATASCLQLCNSLVHVGEAFFEQAADHLVHVHEQAYGAADKVVMPGIRPRNECAARVIGLESKLGVV